MKLGVMSQEPLKIQVKLDLLVSANRKSYNMSCQLAQQRMTLNDLEWPFHGSSVPSVWEEGTLKELNANVNATSSTLKLTPSASRAISAAAELLVYF